MAGFILGEKSEQSQQFDEDGARAPVTFVKTNPCYLVYVNTPDKNGYFSIQLGFKMAKNIAKPFQGKLTKAGIKTPLRFLREFRLEKVEGVQSLDEKGKKGISIGEMKILIGEELKPSALFKKGDKVTVVGVSKGKGFQGVIRRHGFHGGPKTHGQSDRERAPGSIGKGTTPGRVLKGKKMAGRMGGDRITVKGLEVVEVRDDGMMIKGLVPGAKGGLLEIKSQYAKITN
jgi:large subunit ribosomal protein L3